MTDFPALIGEKTNVPTEIIKSAVDLAHIRFRKIKVKKRSGGERIIIQPAAELKLVLAWLNNEVISKLPISPIATAFRKDASILKNASEHKASLYSIRVDIKEFFPSIRSSDLVLAIKSSPIELPPFTAEAGFFDFIQRCCFDRDGRLPIGYPTSPAIANAVMRNIDVALLNKINIDPTKFGQARLTRYADDFVFSSDKPGACRSFLDTLQETLIRTTSPRLAINSKKTRFMSRRGGSTLVTGLRINQDGLVRVHPKYRDHVRLLLKHFANGSISADDVPRLVGHLAFVQHADPRLFTRLSFRYFEEIARLRGKQENT
ncbi:retron St85 family RNA-directed DNA polymerase [Rubrivivax sp. JA1026]|uniref:retron St85 family RNA-directed DNA polymerase n=1 Tax=Rubrivivax sp. JA1026 TaxID=2710888 RepID=UPI0013E944B1|nr:retron St85 family RNA-directed DNA polymerase [Rubrivivax sp. JA1026]